MKQKLMYEKPAMQVFELRNQTPLLAGSNTLPDPTDYDGGGDPFGGA